MINIKISTEFSDSPGGRYKREGDYSGEQFREEILFPRYQDAIKNGDKILVDLDDCYGLPTSFLEEAFGGLVREHHCKNASNIIEFKSDDRPNLIYKIKKYITDEENNV